MTIFICRLLSFLTFTSPPGSKNHLGQGPFYSVPNCNPSTWHGTWHKRMMKYIHRVATVIATHVAWCLRAGLWREPGFNPLLYHFLNCVTWFKSLQFSVPQLFYLLNGDNNSSHLIQLLEGYNDSVNGVLRTELIHNKHNE